MISKKSFWMVLGCLIVYSLVATYGYISTAVAQQRRGYTNITVNNSFRVGTELEAKCDWDEDIENFRFYKRVVVPGKTSKIISVPHGMKNCEIWVLRVFFFGS